MNTLQKPADWSSVHDRCIARLTTEFQLLSALKFHPSDGDYGYRDLRDWGFAIERWTPLFRHGLPVGGCIEYKLAEVHNA